MFASNTSQVSSAANYIEDVFSTYLYAGNSSSQNIVNNIDLSTYGGMVWLKSRSNAENHQLWDTARGASRNISSNSTSQQFNQSPNGVNAFNTNGFSLNGAGTSWNQSGQNYVSWTFRKQPKFFDVVTYTGTGSVRTVAHNLASVPGCIIIKRTDTTSNWFVYHREMDLGVGAAGYSMNLNLTDTPSRTSNTLNDTNPTATVFTLGTNAMVNASGGTYVAYLFAHNAGGFGLSGADNVISCGITGSNGANLGFEPQLVLYKDINNISDWYLFDNMRGVATGGTDAALFPNSSGAENSGTNWIDFNATGFSGGAAGRIYIAIRRGPMKTPTTGTSVFEPAFATANSPEYKSNTVISGFDTALTIYRPGYSDASFSFPYMAARLTGARQILQTSRTNAEYTYSTAANFAYNTGWFDSVFGNDTNRESYMFKRAPSFHDVVCYSGNGANQTLPHNLGAVPQLMITKNRTNPSNWRVYDAFNGATKRGSLNDAQPWDVQASQWNDTAPTATQFTVGTSNSASGSNYVIYLFASCPGVSKVGSYSGTGSNQTIDCGFPSGVRWVLIKRTDTTGDWYVYDTTRGMTSGTDPYILLNSTAAEVTGTNYVETIATGFRLIGSNAGTNANGGTYIYLAIA